MSPALASLAASVCDSQPVISVYASVEWDELSSDGREWVAALVQEAMSRAEPPSADWLNGSFDPTVFGANVREKLARDGKSFRQGSAVIGVSHATLNRVARGLAPDINSYFQIRRWLSATAPPATREGIAG